MKPRQRWAPEGTFARLRAALATPSPAADDSASAHASGSGASSEAPAVAARPLGTGLLLPSLAETIKAHEAKPKRRGPNPETKLEKSIIRALQAHGWRVEKRKVSLQRNEGRTWMHGTPGEADLEVFPGRGLTCFLEVKTPEGRVSDKQRAWIEARRAEGYVAEVVRTAEEAVRVVEGALKESR